MDDYDEIKGAFFGAIFGAIAGLGLYLWLLDGPLLFTGDTTLFGAILGGVIGYYCGYEVISYISYLWPF